METSCELHDVSRPVKKNYGPIGFKSSKIIESIRGLADTSVDHPYLEGNAAGCSYRISGSQEREIVEALLSTSASETVDWCRTARRLLPIFVNDNGNCLDFAIAYALWGSTDMATILRRITYVALVECGKSKYLNRWRRQCQSVGFLMDSEEMKWDEVVKSTMYGQTAAFEIDVPTSSSLLSDSLQVFVLANVLRRPIVVLSSSNNVRGVYLPLLFEAAVCIKHPVVLSYSQSRFIPLVGSTGPEAAMDIVPLVTSEFESLRVWFLLEDEEHLVGDLEQRHMDLIEMNLTGSSYVLSAKLKYRDLEYDFVPPSGQLTKDVTSKSGTGITTRSNMEPTAPSTSMISSVRAESGLLRRDVSMLPDVCAHQNCHYNTSIHTHPFCHEHVKHHVKHGTTSSAGATEPVDQSMTSTTCHHAGCANYASRFIYPYCYEHIDRRIVDNTLRERQPDQTPPDSSVTMIACRRTGCQNLSSCFIYPFCYEHIESRISTGGEPQQQVPRVEPVPTSSEEYMTSILPDTCVYPRCNNRSSVFTFPVCYEHVEYFSSKNRQSFEESLQNRENMALVGGTVPQLASRADNSLPPGGSQLYARAMADIEARTRGIATKCRNIFCQNFGNSRSRGYCHSCFQAMGNP